MNAKKCAREECGKTVYPLEELKCLDKVWHKQCFKCSVCGMTLNMKNYKGYDKKPYCEPHYPKTVASVVVDTPEMRRLQENTKFQSQVKYHADYEKMKGQKIDIADDPETKRHLQNTQVISQVQYHGDHERKKMQEENRPKEELVKNTSSSTSYNNENFSNYSMSDDGTNDPSFKSGGQSGTIIYSSESGGKVPSTNNKNVGSIADYDPLNGNWGSANSGNTAEKLESVINSSNGGAGAKAKKTSTGKKSSSKDNVAAVSPTPSKDAKKDVGFTVRALYDYTAADKDEVSFVEGDVIVNCQKVDEGWITGTVQRTLTWGMLPANYVEKIVPKTGNFKLT
uniref:LIM and SH3 domain protein 1 n=1 Tax=Panagrolaimus sp. JU765 TaxID=591449 RepID=A0AC34PUK0_9BILA